MLVLVTSDLLILRDILRESFRTLFLFYFRGRVNFVGANNKIIGITSVKKMSVDSIVLDEKILQKITCSLCNKCLSFGETKIYPSGKITCGRCWPMDDHFGCKSLYGIVAPYLLFPCTNKRYGCKELLPYDGVEAHEEICTNAASSCPLCPKASKFSLTDLKKHFKFVHPRNIRDTTKYSLNINSFEKTENHLLFTKPFLMLMFVKFDDQWLSINVSVPYEYVGKYKQKVRNFNQSKRCRFLGENDDCFKFFIPRSLNCIADIQLKLRYFHGLCKYYNSLSPTSKAQIDTSEIQIAISFLPREIKNGINTKTELEPFYLPKLYLGEDLKTDLQAIFGDADVKSFTFSPCGKKLINTKIPDISIQVRCNCCENYFWNMPSEYLQIYKCQHFTICGVCYATGYKKCKVDGASFQQDPPLINSIKLKLYCRYDCGGIFKIDQILDHEETCEFNLFRSASDIEFGKLCFGTIFNEKSKLLRSNRIACFSFGCDNSIFIITKDGRKGILHYRRQNDKEKFWVEHEYDKTKFVGVIQILCTDGTIREEENSFFLNTINFKLYVAKMAVFNCILFRTYD